MLRAALARLDRAVSGAPLESALLAAAASVTLWAVVAPFTAARYPAMTDFPLHASGAAVLRHYLDPAYHFREQFELQPIAVPYVSLYALGAAFMLVLPPIVAVKAAAAVMVGLVPAGLAVMFHGMKKSPLLGLLGLGLCWGNLTQWGLLNFVGAIGLFAMAIGCTLLLVDRPTRGRQVALGVVLVALFFTHIFRYPFALCAVVGTAVVMYPATRQIRPILAPLIPALGLMALWMVARPKGLTVETGPIAVHTERFSELVGDLTGGFTDPAERKAFDRFFLVALAVAVVSVGAAAASLVRKKPRETSLAWDAGVTAVPLCCAAVFLGLFLVLPMAMGAWWYVYPREATAAVFVALGAFPDLPRLPWLRVPLTAALALAGLGPAQVVVTNYARFDAVTRDFTAITAQIPEAPKLLYLIFDHGGSTQTHTPFLHLPAYVQAEKGGWLSFHFAVMGHNPIHYRSPEEPGAVVPPPVPLRWEWTPYRFDVRQQGVFFDWFLVRQPYPPDRLFAADPTIERVAHEGSWWLYRRRHDGGP
jgi:hypothetical protein